jgi:hypothetical protein
MGDKKDSSSLLDKRATGGDIAESGFKFQDHLILARIPVWMSYDGFTSMVREALGDVEALFFRPATGLAREFVEFKGSRLTPSEFWPEIDRFKELDDNSPGTYFRFVLSCRGIGETLEPVSNGLKRLRGSLSFYRGQKAIQESSYKDFVNVVGKALIDLKSISSRLANAEVTASFLFEKVDLEVDQPDAEKYGLELFSKSLLSCYPALGQLSGNQIERVRRSLLSLVSSKKNSMIRCEEIRDAVWNAIDSIHHPAKVIRIETLHQEGQEPSDPNYFTLDWARFFGGEARDYPSAEDWSTGLMEPLRALKNWICDEAKPKMLRLLGTRRLSSNLAFGAVFSAVSGFTVDMNHRDESWRTDLHPNESTEDYSWDVSRLNFHQSDSIVCAMGVLRNITADVNSHCRVAGLEAVPRITLFGPSAIVSPQHANKAAQIAKSELAAAIAECGARQVHLFLAVPSHFALFLGHRLNATCIIHCYEQTSGREYVPTCTLEME